MMLKIIWVFAAFTFASSNGIPHDLVKRSDDPQPLEKVVMQQSSEIDSLKAQVAVIQAKLETKDRQVAFFAQFSTSPTKTPASGPYKFDVVKLNDGSGYDSATGIFTAPVSGVYIFAAQFFSYSSQTEKPLLDIKVNGNTYARMAFDAQTNTQTRGEDSDSTSVTVKLQAGDRVWTESALDTSYIFWADFHTFFNGALLYSL